MHMHGLPVSTQDQSSERQVIARELKNADFFAADSQDCTGLRSWLGLLSPHLSQLMHVAQE